MYKYVKICAICLGFLCSASAYSADVGATTGAATNTDMQQTARPMANGQPSGMSSDGYYYGDSCPQDHSCGDTATGDCWCLYCHYEPCYYTTRRCVEEQVPCTRRCCRTVPQEYCVTRCRYVPQYYQETCCRYCKEYYDVCDTKCCKKWVCDTHCRYVPSYYWKHTCTGETRACK